MSTTENFAVEFERKQLPKKLLNLGLVIGLVGLLLVIVSFYSDAIRSSFVSIVTFAFMLSIGIGAFFVVALEYIVGAVWSVPFRRVAESLGAVIFIVPLFLIPALINLHSLYHWTHVDTYDVDPILAGKAPFLNETFFYIRLVVIFMIWWIFYVLITRNSKAQDITGDQKLTKRNITLSAIFMLLLAVTLTLTSIDWLMSLEPHWFSTIFGVYYFSGTVLAGLAAWTYASIKLNEKGFLVKGLRQDHYYSFGALMFAFVNFWAYIAFSQFMLIWYANLPEETFWFIARGTGSWMYISLGMILVHFLIPYALILPQPAKMDPKRLKIVSLWLLFAHFYDIYWLVMPTLDKDGYVFNILDFGFPVLSVGLIIVVFYFVANKKSLLPIKDTKLKQGMDFRL